MLEALTNFPHADLLGWWRGALVILGQCFDMPFRELAVVIHYRNYNAQIMSYSNWFLN